MESDLKYKEEFEAMKMIIWSYFVFPLQNYS